MEVRMTQSVTITACIGIQGSIPNQKELERALLAYRKKRQYMKIKMREIRQKAHA